MVLHDQMDSSSIQAEAFNKNILSTPIQADNLKETIINILISPGRIRFMALPYEENYLDDLPELQLSLEQRKQNHVHGSARIGRITVVIPLNCNLLWNAKAVSLWRIFWNGCSWRNTICPAKNVEWGNSLAIDWQRGTPAATASVPVASR